jgi:hypothetical protein
MHNATALPLRVIPLDGPQTPMASLRGSDGAQKINGRLSFVMSSNNAVAIFSMLVGEATSASMCRSPLLLLTANHETLPLQ